VSLDGWRWDYATRAKVPHLQAVASRGLRAEGLIPAFPSITFPNHYTIVTGLWPEHHGIIANTMVDPRIPERFSMTSEAVRDERWWGGEPLWATAIRQGRLAASMFWVGSEAPTNGYRPTYWKSFDDSVSNTDRVRQVLQWLALPPGQQPAFLTLYMSEADHAGHSFGPDSPQLAAALGHLDDAIGLLDDGIAQLDLADRTTLVIVSDHGMAPLIDGQVIFLDDYIDLSKVTVVTWSPVLELLPRGRSVDDLYQELHGKHRALAVYRREETPAQWHYRDNPRIPPIVGLADEGWQITSHERLANSEAAGTFTKGDHGYDPRLKSMHGLFVAAGPRVRQGVVPEFENIEIYNFLCNILNLTPAANDGHQGFARKLLRD
jgi:predicted AlkP superfamily pyrophosphatase or phosphodiesterase